MFLICLFFLISFYSNLPISPIDAIIGLKVSFSISLLIFTSLSFNYLSFNSIAKINKKVFCFNIFVFIIWVFHSYKFTKNYFKNFKTKVLYLKQFKWCFEFFQEISSDSKWLNEHSYSLHHSYNLHSWYNLHNSYGKLSF